MTLIERLLAQANKESNELADLLNEAAEALGNPNQVPYAYEFTPNKELLYAEELERIPDGDYVPLYLMCNT